MNRKYLKDEEFIKYVIKNIDEFITINVTDSKEKPPVHIIWDAFKAYIRGIIISFSSRKNTELNKKVKQFETDISRAEHRHKKSCLKYDMEHLQRLKLEYDQLLLEKANNVRYNMNKLSYTSSNKTGKQLSALVKKMSKRETIILKDPVNKSVVRDNKRINQNFASFYAKLYSTEIKGQTEEQKNFLKSVNSKKLSEEHKALLAKDISLLEIKKAIDSFPKGKAPG